MQLQMMTIFYCRPDFEGLPSTVDRMQIVEMVEAWALFLGLRIEMMQTSTVMVMTLTTLKLLPLLLLALEEQLVAAAASSSYHDVVVSYLLAC